MDIGKVKIKEGLVHYQGKVFWEKTKIQELAYDLEKQGLLEDAKDLRRAIPHLDWKGKWGWYSAKHAKHHSLIIYSTPDNKKVQVGFVSSNQTERVASWDDLVCIGPVVKYLGKGTDPSSFLESFHLF